MRERLWKSERHSARIAIATFHRMLYCLRESANFIVKNSRLERQKRSTVKITFECHEWGAGGAWVLYWWWFWPGVGRLDLPQDVVLPTRSRVYVKGLHVRFRDYTN